MKKNQLFVLLNLLVTITAFSFLFFNGNDQLVYVDSNKLLSEYQGMVDAQNDYKKLSLEWQARIDTLTMDVQNELKRHEKEVSKMTTKEKGLSEQLIRSKQQQLITYQKAIQEKAAQEDSQRTQAVIEEVNAYIEEFGKKRSYKIILGATSMGNILYAQEGIDITDEVVEGLNRRYRGE
ncbi:OmpH family outer membrane protein [Roseivirga ehrenbergii]|nr:OmpH family outer membrane protein [Roseivirga ehrenbergii]